MQLFKAESFETAGKIMPRATQISTALTMVYIFLTIACGVSYALAGMSWFDAAIHSMTTLATGGMSSHDASMGYFDSVTIEMICISFMILGSLPFLLYVQAVRGRPLVLITDSQVRWFFIILITCIFLAWRSQATGGHEPGLLELRDASFAIVSIMTGTGYTTVDYTQWSSFAITLFFVVMFIGGCYGSTACGLKIFRFQIVFIAMRDAARHLIYPHGVFRKSYNGRPLPDDAISSVISMMFLFFVNYLVISAILGFLGYDILTALSATGTTMACVGPGLGKIVGPAGNFAPLDDLTKWLLSYGMILGRLEVFTIMILFLPSFWRP
jgi:trk system potassium uptake protein TrkH